MSRQEVARADPRGLCQRFAAQNHGVIGGDQARSFGMSPGAIREAVRCGRWRRVFRDTFAVGGAPESLEQLAAAANAAGAVCSHRFAAALYSLDGFRPETVEIVVPQRYRPSRFPSSFIVHRTNHLPDDHVVQMNGLAITSVPRTLLDLAGTSGLRLMRRAAFSAVNKDLVTPEQLLAQLRCCGRPGRPGSAPLRRFLAETDWELDLNDSELEDIACEIIEEAGLPTPKRLHRVYDQGILLGELDLAYPSKKIGIEVDSFAFHSPRPAFVRDRGKWNAFTARSDWRILHFVHEDARHPRRFLDDLRAALTS